MKVRDLYMNPRSVDVVFDLGHALYSVECSGLSDMPIRRSDNETKPVYSFPNEQRREMEVKALLLYRAVHG